MSAQRLGAKSLRRIASQTGIENLKHAVAHGGYVFVLTTRDHRHFEYDKKVQAATPVELSVHFSSCPGGSTDDGDWILCSEASSM